MDEIGLSQNAQHRQHGAEDKENEDQHNGAALFLRHEPVAQTHQSQRQQIRQDIIQNRLHYGVVRTAGARNDQRSADGNIGCGQAADDHQTDLSQSFHQASHNRVRHDGQRVDTQLIAPVDQEPGNDQRSGDPGDQIENGSKEVSLEGKGHGNAHEHNFDQRVHDGVADTCQRSHHTGFQVCDCLIGNVLAHGLFFFHGNDHAVDQATRQ